MCYLEIQTFLKDSATLNGIQTFFIPIIRGFGCDIHKYVYEVYIDNFLFYVYKIYVIGYVFFI